MSLDRNGSDSVAPGLLTIVVDGLSDAACGFLFAEGAFYVKGFFYPRVSIEQGFNILVVTHVYGIDGGQIPVKDEQSAKQATLGKRKKNRTLKI